MPGFALVERRDIMDSLAKDGKGDALDRIMYATSADAIPEQGSKEKRLIVLNGISKDGFCRLLSGSTTFPVV